MSDFLHILITDNYTTWFTEYSDKSTWFQDRKLTIPALHPEDVRYIKNKAGPGCVEVACIETDSKGQYYVECSDSIRFHQYLLADEPPRQLSEIEELEQKFMRDMKIILKEKK